MEEKVTTINNALGPIEITRSYSFKVIADLHGGPKYETQDIFCCAKTSCAPNDVDGISERLYSFCKSQVMNSVRESVNLYRDPPVDESDQAYAKATTAPQTAQGAPYVVAEKGVPVTQPTAQTAAPAAAAQTNPQQGEKAKKPHSIIAERLKNLGMTREEIADSVAAYFYTLPRDTKWTPDQYEEAFRETEAFIKKNTLEVLREGLKKFNAPPAEEIPEVFSTDPATIEALKQVGAKWPLWSPELTRIGALWCADHMQTAAQLEAFLAAAGLPQDAPHVKIAALLAITRHLSLSELAPLLAYAKKTKTPMASIEEALSKTVGKPIRWAMELPNEAVSNALKALTEAK